MVATLTASMGRKATAVVPKRNTPYSDEDSPIKMLLPKVKTMIALKSL